MTQVNENSRDRMVKAARLYAANDKSDPFTLARCLKDIFLGIAEVNGPNGLHAYYSAETYQETRKYWENGEEKTFLATVYKNLVRP